MFERSISFTSSPLSFEGTLLYPLCLCESGTRKAAWFGNQPAMACFAYAQKRALYVQIKSENTFSCRVYKKYRNFIRETLRKIKKSFIVGMLRAGF